MQFKECPCNDKISSLHGNNNSLTNSWHLVFSIVHPRSPLNVQSTTNQTHHDNHPKPCQSIYNQLPHHHPPPNACVYVPPSCGGEPNNRAALVWLPVTTNSLYWIARCRPQIYPVSNTHPQFHGDGRGAADRHAQGARVRQEPQGRVALHGPRRGGHCPQILFHHQEVRKRRQGWVK